MRAVLTRDEPEWNIEVATEAVTGLGGRGIPICCDHGGGAQAVVPGDVQDAQPAPRGRARAAA
ncbi:MAG: hypothetical protein J2P57_06430 [Acidimicrobiaceae bacterium]|nr:hypothetical protein [Acidimicrobiaceae bacterium]